MIVNNETRLNLKPVRYIAMTDCTGKSCQRLKSLLKHTSYYCLVDYYKRSNELADAEIFYTPDCVILEVRSLYNLFSVNKKIQRLEESLPGIKLVLYYSMHCRYPLLEQKLKGYERFNAYDDEYIQLQFLESVLREKE